jgi:hypothetical protein
VPNTAAELLDPYYMFRVAKAAVLNTLVSYTLYAQQIWY